jgi:hypothetical protein
MRFLLLLILLPALVLAQDNDSPADNHESPDAHVETKERTLDWQKEAIDSQILRASQWVDSFFADENFESESATTLIRVRPELYYRKEQGAKGKAKVRIKLSLPNLGQKTSLVIGNDDAINDFNDNLDDSTQETVVGLQFFGKSSEFWHSSLSLGLKFNEFAAYAGPRVRFLSPWGEHKSFAFTQAVRYQSNGYWNTVSRLDFNFILGERYFFRQTFDGRWRGERSDEEGFRTRISSILTQRLPSTAGLQYDFSTIFHTRPDVHVDSYTLALRYRKKSKRDWLYYEIVPQVSFDHDYDYVFNPGIRLRVEFFFGADTSAEFSMREHEDTEDFRW